MNNEKQFIGLLGGGGHANELAAYCGESVAFNAVSAEYLKDGLIDIDNPDNLYKETPVVAAVGSPALRAELVHLWKGQEFATVVAESAYVGKEVEIGEGTVVAPGSILSARIRVGRHVLINIGTTVSHDTNIEDFVTVGPGVSIAGNVSIGEGAFIGIGATINNGLSIARGAVVGAGAVLLEDITEENSVYVGVPARKIRVNEGWLREI